MSVALMLVCWLSTSFCWIGLDNDKLKSRYWHSGLNQSNERRAKQWQENGLTLNAPVFFHQNWILLVCPQSLKIHIKFFLCMALTIFKFKWTQKPKRNNLIWSYISQKISKYHFRRFSEGCDHFRVDFHLLLNP